MRSTLIKLSFLWTAALFAESGEGANLLNSKSLLLNKHWEITEGVLTSLKDSWWYPLDQGKVRRLRGRSRIQNFRESQ
jgi:hypothetical protein